MTTIPKHPPVVKKNLKPSTNVVNFPSGEETVNVTMTAAEFSRWRQFNFMTDHLDRYIRPMPCIVLHHLFRHERNGLATISRARLSDETGFTLKTITASILYLAQK